MNTLIYPVDHRRYITVLTIAGSDPSGGAGLQADLKTFASLECYGMSVVTALTAQNTQGVQSIYSLPISFVREQLESIFHDIHQIDAIKIGMLEREEIIEQVVTFLRERSRLPALVVDPVMFAKGGDQLIRNQAINCLKEKVLPLATVITPNLHEARRLLDNPSIDNLETIAFQLLKLGPQAVVIKGRDGRDCLAIKDEDKPIWMGDLSDWIPTKNVHGTGCTFAAAIASFLARGESIVNAVQKAKLFITKAICEGARYQLGHGHGPVYHQHYLQYIGNNFIQEVWFSIDDLYRRIQQLPFLLELADGCLPWQKFESFIHQDCLFLLDRAKVCSRFASKTDHELLRILFQSIHDKSMTVAGEVFSKYNIKHSTALATKSPVCSAYTEYLNQTSNIDELTGLIALVPCTLIYQKIGEYLNKLDTVRTNSNPSYRLWINTYSSEERRDRVENMLNIVNRAVMICSMEELVELKQVFQKVSQYEHDLWDEAYRST